MLQCPKCHAKQSALTLRSEFHCPNCGATLMSNALSLGIIGMLLLFVPTFLLPTTGWPWAAELAAYLALGALTIPILLPFVRLKLDSGTRDP